MFAWTNSAIRLRMERIRHQFGDFANMLSLIHRNLNREFVCAIWAEVLVWFTNGELIVTATE
jgi:hypothetical protein